MSFVRKNKVTNYFNIFFLCITYLFKKSVLTFCGPSATMIMKCFRGPTQNLGPIGSAVLTFIKYGQTSKVFIYITIYSTVLMEMTIDHE